jgi:type 1 glutamine amidotransferase
MKYFSFLLAGLLLLTTHLGWAQNKPKEPEFRVLVFSKTVGFRHESISSGLKMLRELADKNNFTMDATEDASFFTTEFLKRYQAVIFLNTTGNILDDAQQKVFEDFIHNGGGFVGIHSASDTEYDWPWYGKLVGAYFTSHPNNPNVRTADFRIQDKKHPTTAFLPDPWRRVDEFYNFKNINPDFKTLITIDEKSYEGGTNGDFHPMSWCHEFEGGRAFYTNFGHTHEAYEEPLVRRHILEGIKWAVKKS